MSAQVALYGGMAALQLAGGYFAAQNIRESAALNEEIAEMNAEFAELDAYDAQIEGFTQEAKYQTVVDQTLGEQQAALTAAGVDVNYGSAGTIQKETRFIAELNKKEIEKNAQERALGYTRQARDYRFKGALGSAQAGSKAGQALFQGVAGAAQSAAGAAQSAAGAARTGLTGYARSK